MKRLMFAACAVALLSCNNGGNTEGSGNADSINAIAPDTGYTGDDTTGLNVGAAQPVDSTDTLRDPMPPEPGASRSGVKYKINGGDTQQQP